MKWMNIIEKNIIEKTGVGLLDLPDQEYYIMFEDGTTTSDVVDLICSDLFIPIF